MPVGRLLDELDADELMEWSEWEKLTGPLGCVREDLRAAHLCQTVVNMLRGKGDRPLKLEEFLIFPNPWFGKKAGRNGAMKTPQDMLAFFMGLARRAGEDVDGRRDLQEALRAGGGEHGRAEA